MLWIQKDLANNLLEDFREFLDVIRQSEFVQAFRGDLLAPIGPLFLLLLLSGSFSFFFGALLSYVIVVITLSFSNKGKLLLPDSNEILDEFHSGSPPGFAEYPPEFITVDDHETVEWINVWLRTIWKVQKKPLEKKIMDSISGIMDAVNPIKMVNLEIPEVELGSNPPFLEKIRSYRQTPNKEIHADFELTLDEPDARVKITAGEKIAFPVVLSNLKISGNIHLEMRLSKASKVIEEVRLSFFEAPQVSFDLKPMHSVNIMQVPLVSTWLRHLIFSVLSEFLVNPNMIVIPIESIEISVGEIARGITSIIPPKPKEFSCGIAKITILEASEIPRPDRLGTCNPYIALSIDGGAGTQLTQVKRQDFNPSWNEHFYFPVMDPLAQQVSISLYDESSRHSDELIERWVVPILMEESASMEMPTVRELILSFPSKSGYVKCIMEQRSILSSCDPTFQNSSGLVHVTIHSGQQLKTARAVHVSAYFGREWELYRTQTATHFPKNPTWDEQFEFVVESITEEMLHFVVSDSRTGALLGEHKLRLHEFLDGMPFQNRVWLELWNVERGKLCISLEWRPIDLSIFQVFDAKSNMSEGPLPVSQSMNFQNNEGEGLSKKEIKEKEKYVASVSRGSFAKVLVTIHRAKELADLLMGKTHPYVVVRSGAIKYFKTTTKKKTLDPIWEETFPIPISFESSTNPLLIFEIKDDDILGMSRSLGSVEVPLQALKESPDEPINGSFPVLKGGYQKGWLDLTIVCEKVKARSSISRDPADYLLRRGSQASTISSSTQMSNGTLPTFPPIACGCSSSFFPPAEQREE